jgi:hypothetical protein
LHEAGLTGKWKVDNWPKKSSKCLPDETGQKSERSLSVLKLADLQGAFFALMIGISLAFIVFIAEAIIFTPEKVNKYRNQKNGFLKRLPWSQSTQSSISPSTTD